MGNDVFANNREISCKKADGKSICCFPDVCLTPPPNVPSPFGPGVPVPYPNTAFSKDTSSGSRSVKITRKEIMLKNKSYFKTSTGNEAGCATPAKKGILTGKIKGKLYFTSWSMDVKAEGENVVRNLDIATHNHGSFPGNTATWPYIDTMAVAPPGHPCKDEIDKVQEKCGQPEIKDGRRINCTEECKTAMNCVLPPKKNDKKLCCDPNNTGHHLIEDQWVKNTPDFPNYVSYRNTDNTRLTKEDRKQGKADENDAPTVCVNATRKKGTPHRRMHDIQGVFAESYMEGGVNYKADEPSGGWNYGEGKNSALVAHNAVFHDAGCSQTCLESQLDDFYGKDNSRSLNPITRKQGVGSKRKSTTNELGSKLKRRKILGDF